jgi:uncharacterized protein (TIGR02246 family)
MPSDEQSVRDLVALWHSATNAGDIDTVLALMTDDVVFLVAGRPPMRGRSLFESGLRKLLTTHRIESAGDVREVEVSGDLAYCWSELKVSVVPRAGGDPTTRRGSDLSILRRRVDGRWAVARDANLLPSAT